LDDRLLGHRRTNLQNTSNRFKILGPKIFCRFTIVDIRTFEAETLLKALTLAPLRHPAYPIEDRLSK
jgi:hypothetical protein